jgi:hypothetical protein
MRRSGFFMPASPLLQNKVDPPGDIQKKSGMKCFALLLTASALIFLSACEKKQPPGPPSPPVTTTTGILDHSRWSKWVQDQPRVILVSDLDEPTNKLISTQTRIFTNLVSPAADTNPLPAGDVEAQLETVKNTFPATQKLPEGHLQKGGYLLTQAIDVPHPKRGDYYRSTLSRATLGNLPDIIIELERKIAADLRELESQLNSLGPAGGQARADSAWLQSRMTTVVDRLKKVGRPSFVSPASPAEKAREEWMQFEAAELHLIKRAVDAKTLAQATVNKDGTFSVNGKGHLIAIITVAGRPLYFPIDQPGALRFSSVETSVK